LTEQQLDTSAIPESLEELIDWCKDNDFFCGFEAPRQSQRSVLHAIV
jgi:hypothetical protein